MSRNILTLVALTAAIAGCRGEAGHPPPRSGAEAGLAALASRTDMSGAKLALEGNDATVVVVFATWCGPCRKELAVLGELRETRPKLRIIGLNAYEEFEDFSDENKLEAFLAQKAPWLTVVRDDGTLLRAFGGVPKIPTLFVYDRHGKVVREFRRNKRPPPDHQELASAIDAALARS